MIKVNLGSRSIAISWIHRKETRSVPLDRRQRVLAKLAKVFKAEGKEFPSILRPLITSERERQSITCTIRSIEGDGTIGDAILSRASLRMHFKDRLEYEVGRKISLARALKFTNLTREERTILWNAYHARKEEQAAKQAIALKRKAAEIVASADMHAGEI